MDSNHKVRTMVDLLLSAMDSFVNQESPPPAAMAAALLRPMAGQILEELCNDSPERIDAFLSRLIAVAGALRSDSARPLLVDCAGATELAWVDASRAGERDVTARHWIAAEFVGGWDTIERAASVLGPDFHHRLHRDGQEPPG